LCNGSDISARRSKLRTATAGALALTLFWLKVAGLPFSGFYTTSIVLSVKQ